MPLNTSFIGNIPWLITEPPSAALARGASIGQGIAAARQARHALRQQGEQFAERQALERAQEERLSTLASHRFMAQQAYQAAVERDIAAAEDEAANYGLELDDPARINIAARNFLRYGPVIGEGFGPSLASMVNQQVRGGMAEERLALDKERVGQAAIRLKQGATRLDLERLGYSLREIDQAQRGLGLGVEPIRPASTAPVMQPGYVPDVTGQPVPGTVAPDSTKPLFKPTERPLTSGAATDLQKSNAKLDTSIANVAFAIKQIEAHPEAFGPQGWAGEWKERIQGMFDPDIPTPITGARTTAGTAAHDLIMALKTDPQVSNFERKAIDEVIGKPTEFWTNPARIKGKFQVLLETAAARRMRQGKLLRQPIDPADLNALSNPEHVKSLVREGTLTPTEAIQWGRTHLPAQ